jgi:serine O-acetyltransferase
VSSARVRRSETPGDPCVDSVLGSTNHNPAGLSLRELWREDLWTHNGEWGSEGFLAIALHRFGNWRMDVRTKVLRAPLTILYRVLARWVRIRYGIKLEYTVKLGRRVRIWHSGGMVLGAKSIGDDVNIRQNTTFGVARRGDAGHLKPVIGDRVDIGCGVCILGAVTVGSDSIIGANAVVLRDVPPNSLAVGVPARIIDQVNRSGSVE